MDQFAGAGDTPRISYSVRARQLADIPKFSVSFSASLDQFAGLDAFSFNNWRSGPEKAG